jgi:hypothetical protein
MMLKYNNLTKYNNKEITQKNIVETIIDSIKNVPNDPSIILKEIGIIKQIIKEQQIDWTIIKENIDNNNPIIVRVGSPDFGHYVLLVGYKDIIIDKYDKQKRGITPTIYYIDPIMEIKHIDNELLQQTINNYGYTESQINNKMKTAYIDKKTKLTFVADDFITGYCLTKRQ